ncbi:MAG TPA: HAD family hydrolase [Chryseosolibacter sp.]|nr:HAD family hydrolase [Chryseosolibacter sp.]
MIIRAVCTDIDGTLLDRTRQLSKRTIAAFGKIPPDVPVILASSRMPSAMTHLQAELRITQYPLICYNGGYVVSYNSASGVKIFDSVKIPAGVCESILACGKASTIHFSLYADDNWYAPQHDAWTEREETITKVRATIAKPEEVIHQWRRDGSGAHKIMCMGDAGEIGVLHKLLNEKHGGDIHVYLSRPTYLELAPKSVSKGSALKLLLENEFRIPLSEVVAFGDNYNDIDLLSVAGVGVAVANARPEVKAISDQLTSASIDDGVAAALEEILRF